MSSSSTNSDAANGASKTGTLMAGKRGLIMGVANDRSIAWGIAKSLHQQGAELAFTYQGESLGKRVLPLAATVGSDLVLPCDVCDEDSIDSVMAALKDKWGKIDFLVHSLAYSDKEELKGRYVDTSRQNFLKTMDISCFSFTDMARRAAEIMPDGGAMISLSFGGAESVMPNYNVMGVAKAALEASTRYLAADLGPQGIRVNVISAGPMRTLAGSAISGARHIYRWSETHSPLRKNAALEDIGGSALYLLSDLSASVTGEIHHVDNGYNIIGIPAAENLISDS